MKTAEDFRRAATERNIDWWPSHKCSMCGYQLGYVINGLHVGFDPGCYCVNSRGGVQPRSWEHLADHYNMQRDPSVIKKMDEFWGFAPTNA